MNIRLPLLFLVLWMHTTANAQIPLFFHVSGHGAFPLSTFKSKGYENGGGIQMMLLSGALNPKGKTAPWERGWKIQAGGGIEINSFGSRSFKIDLAEPAGAIGRQKITNSSGAFYGVLRGSYTPFPLLTPFVEGIAGVRNYTSQELISVNGTSQSQTTDTFRARTFTVGIGVGFALKVTHQFFIEAKTTWCWGGNGTYQPLSKISQPQNQVFYNSQTSGTNLLLTQIGFIWQLGSRNGCCLGICGNRSSGRSSRTNSAPNNNITTPRSQPPRIVNPTPPPPQKKIIVKPDPPKTKPRG